MILGVQPRMIMVCRKDGEMVSRGAEQYRQCGDTDKCWPSKRSNRRNSRPHCTGTFSTDSKAHRQVNSGALIRGPELAEVRLEAARNPWAFLPIHTVAGDSQISGSNMEAL